MRGNRKGSIKKERIIMITSSALVLAALTMTGVYVKNRSAQTQDDGYSIDFSALEDTPGNKIDQLTPSSQSTQNPSVPQTDLVVSKPTTTDDDLDYAPPTQEVDSGKIEIGNKPVKEGDEGMDEDEGSRPTTNNTPKTPDPVVESSEPVQEANSGIVEVAKTLAFPDALIRPAAGSVLIPFSMDGSVYFATLDQYKYSPAMVLDATEGDAVRACSEGQVVSRYSNEELGNVLVLDLGDGYQASYGQLRDIPYQVGDYVNAGDTLGFVAAPTKYYSVEGANIYFALQKDQDAIDPSEYFAE
ncbi:MAG: M23 family metallopeptidase [Clostridium sp.]|jgi:murein DD-endopeptidase MepM/ murein hydrolase activator NlpD|nr:M23 family metallopeptidase [Clostridium sp.]